MDLGLDTSLGCGLSSASQRTRRMTEDWVTRNLFCLACKSDRLYPARPNKPVFDHTCPQCYARYQIKGKKSAFGNTVINSEYQHKTKAIRDGEAPHYAFLSYSDTVWSVTDLFVIPGHFLSLRTVRQRPPLKHTAKRAGHIGSQILLNLLPDEARVYVVKNGIDRSPPVVRRDWKRYEFLKEGGGWTADILSCVRILELETSSTEFALQDFYNRFEDELASRYPENQNIKAKIRQQLQYLRNRDVITFLGKGRYWIKPYKLLEKGNGWTADILSCLRIFEAESRSATFALADFYNRFESELASRYPENRNVKAKIRPQLQLLRDQNLLTFLGKGRYRIEPPRQVVSRLRALLS